MKHEVGDDLVLFKSIQCDLKMEFGAIQQMHQNIVW